MNSGKNFTAEDPENPKYFTLFGTCHVSTATKIISLIELTCVVTFLISFDAFEFRETTIICLFISLVYLTPFIGIIKFQPWALIPLLMLIAFDIFFAGFCIITLPLTMDYHQNVSSFCSALVLILIYICYETFYFCVTNRYFQYIKEMKIVQQKQNIDVEKVIYC